jgi:hypothetical protein
MMREAWRMAGHGHQQLNISTTEFLRRWVGGHLDLPVLSLPPVARRWAVTPAGDPVVAEDVAPARRDPLAQLATIIGPGSPQACDWPAAERGLGRPLPSDYKRLHEAYGSPFAQNGLFVSAPGELLSTHTMLADTLADMCEDAGSGYQVHPAPGGLLLCLTTESRDLLCWDTRDPDPDAWPVVYLDEEEVFPGTLTEILVAELTGTGPGLAEFELGDPGEWAWPFWGPDEPWW